MGIFFVTEQIEKQNWRLKYKDEGICGANSWQILKNQATKKKRIKNAWSKIEKPLSNMS